jgi:hypothetical protein
MSLIYAVSAFFSILYYSQISYSRDFVIIDIEPTFWYCFLLTLSIIPFSLFNLSKRLEFTPIRNVLLFKSIVWIMFALFLLYIYTFSSDIYAALTGNVVETRLMAYGINDNSLSISNTPFYIRYPLLFFLSLVSGIWPVIFLAFYATLLPNLPKRYPFLLLMISFSTPLYAFRQFDRSATIYWLISFVAIYIVFRKKIPDYYNAFILRLAFFLIIGCFIYLGKTTIQRFEDQQIGTWGSICRYSGESFVNYCRFYTNYRIYKEEWGSVFPVTVQLLTGIRQTSVGLQREVSKFTSLDSNVFYTFMGMIMIGLGQFKSIIAVFLYNIASFLILLKMQYFRFINSYSLYIIFYLASVVFLGLFGHFYANGSCSLSALFFFFLFRFIIK